MYAEGQTLKITATESNPLRKIFTTITVTVVDVTDNIMRVKLSAEDAAKHPLKREVVSFPFIQIGPTFYPDWTIEIIEDEKQEKPAVQPKGDVPPTALAGLAADQALAWGEAKRMSLYNSLSDSESRITKANGWLATLEGRGYTRAQAQLVVFGFLGAIYTEGTRNTWMANFTEKMHEQLVNKVSSFGPKAYPLTDKQFDAAVKAAW